jgi:hypothetical protein
MMVTGGGSGRAGRAEVAVGLEMRSVSSSVIEAVGYDGVSSRLTVRFLSGKTYVYLGVERARFDELMAAESKGAYFNREIRPRYRCEQS